MRSVGIFFDESAPRSVAAALSITRASYAPHAVNFEAYGPTRLDLPDGVEFVVSIGGDGTFLRTVMSVKDADVPIFGVNTGHLGFLTSGLPEYAPADVMKILDGEHSLSEKMLLRAELIRYGEVIAEMSAYNEISMLKDSPSCPIDLDVCASDGRLYRVLADGLIVASPTGSTAYALSAGGPIINPDMRCMLVMPVSPHSLSIRPLILTADDAVEARFVGGNGKTTLSRDGRDTIELEVGDIVRVTVDHGRRIRVIRVGEASFYDVLRSKFDWGCSALRERDWP